MPGPETPTRFLPADPRTGRPSLPPTRMIELADLGPLAIREVAGPADRADAVPIVLLHGWTVTSAVNWFAHYRAVAKRGRVISFDQRGHGDGLRPGGPFRLRDVADDVVAVLDALALPRAIVVGYSMGGIVAQRVAHRHPDRIAGAVLCATWAHGPSSGGRNLLLRGTGLAAGTLARLPRRQRAQLVGFGFRAAGGSLAADTPQWFIDEVRAGDLPTMVDAGRALASFDSRPWLHELRMPTAVVVTSADTLVPPARQHELAALLGRADLETAPTDHDGVVVEPERFRPALLAALDRVVDRVESGS